MTEFLAEYPGRCGACGEPIDVGELARYVDDEVVHVECFTLEEAFRDICPDCFTERAVNGECLCIGW